MILEIGMLGVGMGAVRLFQCKERYHRECMSKLEKIKKSEKSSLEDAVFHYTEWYKAKRCRKGAAVVATAGALGTTLRVFQVVGLVH